MRWNMMGEDEGKSYEDRGEIVVIEPERRLKVTPFSPLSGQDDVSENDHTLTAGGVYTRVLAFVTLDSAKGNSPRK